MRSVSGLGSDHPFHSRWAAKEAVIKAHHHRRLYMHEVSIVKSSRFAAKSVALVDPICDIVELDMRVAGLRGLRGFAPETQDLPKGPPITDKHDGEVFHGQRLEDFSRRRKIGEGERQVAEISISHDGLYAVATCMAFDPPTPPEQLQQSRRIVDDGKHAPIHEPQWGDKGWFDKDTPDGQGTRNYETEDASTTGHGSGPSNRP